LNNGRGKYLGGDFRFVERKMHFFCQNVYLTALDEEPNLAVTDLFYGITSPMIDNEMAACPGVQNFAQTWVRKTPQVLGEGDWVL